MSNGEKKGRLEPATRQGSGPTEFDPKRAQEQELGSSSPPSSHPLLDAALQNPHDFGEAEDEAEQKRIRKKRENKRDVGTPEPQG